MRETAPAHAYRKTGVVSNNGQIVIGTLAPLQLCPGLQIRIRDVKGRRRSRDIFLKIKKELRYYHATTK